jgi:hypothetical protein
VQLAAAWAIVPFVWRSLRAAGIAPSARGTWWLVIGLLLPGAVCLAISQLLRRTGAVGPDTSVAAAALELAVSLVCFVLVAIPGNLGVLRELWQLRTRTKAAA